MNPRVISVKPLNNYCLELGFSNHETRIFDVSPYLEKGIFCELKLPKMFNTVKVIDGTIQWLNEADFCPDTLYLESTHINNQII